MGTTDIRFTHRELSGLLDLFTMASEEGRKLTPEQQWAADRIFRHWKALAGDPGAAELVAANRFGMVHHGKEKKVFKVK